MTAKLISYSQNENHDSLLDQIAYAARVSNPSNQHNKETSEKLVRYLIRENHWSPLEMVSACIEIDTTRDIARQILRHRSFSFQEFSQRYANPLEDLKMSPTAEIRAQDPKNRQNSVDREDVDIQMDWIKHQCEVINAAKKAYEFAIDNGIAKELARKVLPEGLTESRMYMNGTLRSWIHFIELRSGNGTQKECQEVALACAKAIAEIFPLTDKFIND